MEIGTPTLPQAISIVGSIISIIISVRSLFLIRQTEKEIDRMLGEFDE